MYDYRHSVNDTFTVLPGGQVNSFQPRGFSQIYGVWIDNFSGGWLSVEGHNLWCPPYTRGWKASIFPGMSSISVKSYDFANGVVITGATGQAAQVTIWNNPQGDSEGIDFFDQQTVPINFCSTNIQFLFNQPLIAAPAAGRIRLYDVGFMYSQQASSTSAGAQFFLLRAGGISQVLDISPATPVDRYVYVKPGGDLPIGSAVTYTCQALDFGDTQQPMCIYIRYAVI